MRLDLRGLACGGKQPSNGYNNLILQPQDAEAIEEEPFRLSPSQIRSLIELRPNTIAAATAAQWELLRDYIGGKNCSIRFSRRSSPVA